MAGLCQDCTGCCETLEVREIPKAFGERCKYLGQTANGPGCTIYEEKPGACRTYVCLWLSSQVRPAIKERMGEALRPDVCKVVMGWPWGIERNTLHVFPYPGYPDAWKQGAFAEHLKMILSRGGKVVVYVNKDQVYALRGTMGVVGTEKEFADVLNHPDSEEMSHVG